MASISSMETIAGVCEHALRLALSALDESDRDDPGASLVVRREHVHRAVAAVEADSDTDDPVARQGYH